MAVSKSTNGGTVWTRYILANPGYTFALAVDPSNSNTVYVGGFPGVYKTTNGGSNWSLASTGITDTVFAMVVDYQNSNTLYVGTPDGVFKTTNGGGSWTNVGCSRIKALLMDPQDPNTIYAGGGNGVYKTTNSGSSWSAMNDGLPASIVTSLGMNPGQYLFAGTDNAALFRWPFMPGVTEGRPDSKIQFLIIPNPSHGKITIRYQVTKSSIVELGIYDAEGRLVTKVTSGYQGPGRYCYSFSNLDSAHRRVPAGVYFCRLSIGGISLVKKLILLK